MVTYPPPNLALSRRVPPRGVGRVIHLMSFFTLINLFNTPTTTTHQSAPGGTLLIEESTANCLNHVIVKERYDLKKRMINTENLHVHSQLESRHDIVDDLDENSDDVNENYRIKKIFVNSAFLLLHSFLRPFLCFLL